MYSECQPGNIQAIETYGLSKKTWDIQGFNEEFHLGGGEAHRSRGHGELRVDFIITIIFWGKLGQLGGS